MKKRKIFIPLVLIILLGIIAAIKLFSSAEKKTAKKDIKTAIIQRGSIQMNIACTGKIVSNLDVEIKSKASGKVIKLPYDISHDVRASTLLVELDPTDEQRNVEKAEATIEAAKARLNHAKQELMITESKVKTALKDIQAELESAKAAWEDAESKAKREEQLFKKNLSSREQLDTRQTEAIRAKTTYERVLVKEEELMAQEMEVEIKRQAVQLEESKVRSAAIDLEIANQCLQDTRILSPIDGVVTSKYVQIGQIISSGINTIHGGTTLLVVSDLSRIFVIASVDESDIGKVELGQKVEISVDSYPETTFLGKIVQIATKGINVSNVVTFDVKIEISGKNKNLLKPEMTANVKIIAQEKEDVVLAPEEAVDFSQQGPEVRIFSADGTITPRAITLGLTNGKMAEITKGVKEGEIVLLNPGQIQSKWSNVKKAKDF